jgi:uncharacterized protein
MQFADTFYFLALLNSKDRAHSRAIRHSFGPGRLITTEWVLMETADAMCVSSKRKPFIELHRMLRADPSMEIVPASAELFGRGMALFEARQDKDWSFTDCTSFVVMRDRGIQEALTGDHHFEQAGFLALLKAE